MLFRSIYPLVGGCKFPYTLCLNINVTLFVVVITLSDVIRFATPWRFLLTWHRMVTYGQVIKMAVTPFDPPYEKTPCHTQTAWLYILYNQNYLWFVIHLTGTPRDTLAQYSWPCSVSWCLAAGYRKETEISAAPMGSCGLWRLLFLLFLLCYTFMHRDFRLFWLTWPWPWLDDLHMRTWLVFSGDIPHLQIWTSNVKVFESCRLVIIMVYLIWQQQLD